MEWEIDIETKKKKKKKEEGETTDLPSKIQIWSGIRVRVSQNNELIYLLLY